MGRSKSPQPYTQIGPNEPDALGRARRIGSAHVTQGSLAAQAHIRLPGRRCARFHAVSPW